MPHRAGSLPGLFAARWRTSLRFRIVLGTAVGATCVVALLSFFLVGTITRGVLAAKEAGSLAEATAARSEAQRLLEATPAQGSAVTAAERIDSVVAAMGARGAQVGLFEVLVLASEPAGLNATPERGTNLVSEQSVPAGLRAVVAEGQRQAWTYTRLQYTDGRSVPAFVVGAPLNVPDVGPYELYQLFPLVQEEDTIALVRNATAVSGLLIVLGLVVLAAAITYGLVRPVHEAARTARAFSTGHLDARMRVRGEDDLAQLAVSFNEMADALGAQIQDLEQLSTIQQRFVADVSHELRTPLTTVRMAADLLQESREDLPADNARAVELLQKQLNRFEALLADLLETSRQDAGAVHLDYEDVDLRQLAGRVAGSMQALARELQCAVDVVGLPELVVTCDVLRVERIIANLLSNALEHGAGHPVLVRVTAVGDRALVAVVDQGSGLSDDDLSRVFTRFWRADPSRERRVGGTGLGLSIALGDARAHGGTITADSAPGRGATFTLDLPVTPRSGPMVTSGAVGEVSR